MVPLATSIPFSERSYQKSDRELEAFLKRLEKLPKTEKLAKIRVIAYHNLKQAKQMLKK